MTPLDGLQERLGYTFHDSSLLEQALTHSSFGNLEPASGCPDYERLEFLGDAILGLVIAEILFRRFPRHREGQLSKMKGFLVSRAQLHRLSKELEVADSLRLSPGEEKTGGRRKKAILADVLESIIAAIYLDGGLEPVRSLLERLFADSIDRIASKQLDFVDHKSRLQERLHARGQMPPEYRLIDERGPDHRKEFVVEAVVDDVTAHGEGRSKKAAQQKAARDLLGRLPDSD